MELRASTLYLAQLLAEFYLPLIEISMKLFQLESLEKESLFQQLMIQVNGRSLKVSYRKLSSKAKLLFGLPVDLKN